MKLSLLLPLAYAATLVAATCRYQSLPGTYAKGWRLSTYKSENCINKASDVTHGGFGIWCVNFPNNVRSFIFTVGTYGPLESCKIFFKTGNSCGSGKTVGRSSGRWMLSKLSATGKTMGSAEINCGKLFNKRDGEAVEGVKDRKFVMGEDGDWYEEVGDGVVVRAATIGDEDSDWAVPAEDVYEDAVEWSG